MATPTPVPNDSGVRKTKPYKAIFAFVVAVAGFFSVALAGRDTFSNMTPMEWTLIVLFIIVNTGGVYGIRNPAASPTEPHRG